jgi:hypothetical protein
MARVHVKASIARLLVLAAAAALLSACGSDDTAYPETTNIKPGSSQSTYTKPDSVLGSGGLNLFGGDEAPQVDPGGGGIGVNSYLWRASLDTISFMPLASADPFGGVIITDWYAPPESQSERFKVNVYILGRDLRADGVRAAVFRQRQDVTGNWIDAAVGQETAIDLEDAILTRARQLRIASIQ